MTIPSLDFASVANRLRRYWIPSEYNPHIGLIGSSRSGKSYLIRHGILPIADGARIVVIDVKPGGSRTWAGWGDTETRIEKGFFLNADGNAHYRMILRPGDTSKTEIRRVLNLIANEGDCIVVIDDVPRITANTPNLGLSGEVNQLVTLGAESNITVILGGNSQVDTPSSLRNQCGRYFYGHMQNQETIKKVSGYINLPMECITAISSLHDHRFLYADQYSDEMALAITRLEA